MNLTLQRVSDGSVTDCPFIAAESSQTLRGKILPPSAGLNKPETPVRNRWRSYGRALLAACFLVIS
jgi:hypothetical protein